jgi:protein-L-isoaspartate(D-aspartate) O-methyltransferase
VDIHADFTAAAPQRLHAAGVGNVDPDHGRSGQRLAADGLFDALVVTGAVFEIPQRWLTWLKPVHAR